MLELLSTLAQNLKEANIPIVLIVVGSLFLFLSLVGRFGAYIDIPKERHPLVGGIGGVFLIIGVWLAAVPKKPPPEFPTRQTSTASNSSPAETRSELGASNSDPENLPEKPKPAVPASDDETSAAENADSPPTQPEDTADVVPLRELEPPRPLPEILGGPPPGVSSSVLPEEESNDHIYEAQEIQPEVNVHGEIKLGNIDWYTFTTGSDGAGKTTIVTRTDGISKRIQFHLLDSNEQVIDDIINNGGVDVNDFEISSNERYYISAEVEVPNIFSVNHNFCKEPCKYEIFIKKPRLPID